MPAVFVPPSLHTVLKKEICQHDCSGCLSFYLPQAHFLCCLLLTFFLSLVKHCWNHLIHFLVGNRTTVHSFVKKRSPSPRDIPADWVCLPPLLQAKPPALLVKTIFHTWDFESERFTRDMISVYICLYVGCLDHQEQSPSSAKICVFSSLTYQAWNSV